MNNTFYSENDYRYYLAHHGVKGMRWGVRRFQNADGSYTSAGKSRYGVGDGQTYSGVKSVKGSLHRLAAKNYDLNAKTYDKLGNKTLAGMNRAAAANSRKKAEAADAAKAAKQLTPEQRAARNAKIKKAAITVGAVAATAAIAYAGTKYMRHIEKEARGMMDVGKTNVHVGILNARQNHLTLADIYTNDAPKDLGHKMVAEEHRALAGIEKRMLRAREGDLTRATYSKNVRNMARKEAFKNDIRGITKGRDSKYQRRDEAIDRITDALWKESGNTDVRGLDRQVSMAIDQYIKKKR